MPSLTACSCCFGWSILCAIILFAIGGAFAGKLSMGEYLSDDDFKDLSWQSFVAGGIWVLVAIITGIWYVFKVKKEERQENQMTYYQSSSSSSSS